MNVQSSAGGGERHDRRRSRLRPGSRCTGDLSVRHLDLVAAAERPEAEERHHRRMRAWTCSGATLSNIERAARERHRSILRGSVAAGYVAERGAREVPESTERRDRARRQRRSVRAAATVAGERDAARIGATGTIVGFDVHGVVACTSICASCRASWRFRRLSPDVNADYHAVGVTSRSGARRPAPTCDLRFRAVNRRGRANRRWQHRRLHA